MAEHDANNKIRTRRRRGKEPANNKKDNCWAFAARREADVLSR
jgi:hypothetical protein